MLSSSYIHSNSFSCNPSVASTSSNAASNKSVNSEKTIGAESKSSVCSTIVSSQSDRKAGLSSEVQNDRKNKDASKADLEEVMPHWIRFLLCWGESSTPNSDSDTMTNKDLLLQDLLQVEYNYNLQQSKHQGMLQSYSSHSINTNAKTSNSSTQASVGIPDDRSDISTKRSTRSLVKGSSLTTSSRQFSSNGSSDSPKAAYENFIGGKTNTTTISSETTSSKTHNSSSSHNPKASSGLSSLSTKSSELDSSMITAAPLQCSSTSCSSSEAMSDRRLKANTTNIISAHSASATSNSSKSSYGSLISSTSRSIADSSFATSSHKYSSLSLSSSGKVPVSYLGLKTSSDTAETSNLSIYCGATLSSVITSPGVTALSLISNIGRALKKCSRKIIRYFDSKGKPPLPPRNHSENNAMEVSFEQVSKNESMVMKKMLRHCSKWRNKNMQFWKTVMPHYMQLLHVNQPPF
jgi:hypothetical protein